MQVSQSGSKPYSTPQLFPPQLSAQQPTSTATAVNWPPSSPLDSRPNTGSTPLTASHITPKLEATRNYCTHSKAPTCTKRPRDREEARARADALQRKLEGDSLSDKKIKAVQEKFSWVKGSSVTDAKGRVPNVSPDCYGTVPHTGAPNLLFDQRPLPGRLQLLVECRCVPK
jgi:hypothetical protein